MPKAADTEFPEEGTHLERYSKSLNGVEINSAFYKSHRPSTYARWAASVPDNFRFAVKIPREITHRLKLVGTNRILDSFHTEVTALNTKLGPLLVQLPPSLAFEAKVAETFFTSLRARFTGSIACEPRHVTWFTTEAENVFTGFQIGRVAADPALIPVAAHPGGWQELVYYRLHGSPRMYYSAYSEETLKLLVQCLRNASKTATVWCIFDNTALGAATHNALDVSRQLVGDKSNYCGKSS